jgi:hypothetical protein
MRPLTFGIGIVWVSLKKGGDGDDNTFAESSLLEDEDDLFMILLCAPKNSAISTTTIATTINTPVIIHRVIFLVIYTFTSIPIPASFKNIFYQKYNYSAINCAIL